MLVSGSYVGWMVKMMRELFVGGRLKQTPISSKLTFDDGLEAVYRYAKFNQVEVSDESAIVINRLTQSDPFYIASLFRSDWEFCDFSTVQGAIKTLAYEVRNRKGDRPWVGCGKMLIKGQVYCEIKLVSTESLSVISNNFLM